METVRKLLAGGANPNTKDHAGWTPLVSYIPDYNMANLTCFIVPPILGDPTTAGLSGYVSPVLRHYQHD